MRTAANEVAGTAFMVLQALPLCSGASRLKWSPAQSDSGEALGRRGNRE
jgi:hypothetical protein